MAGSRSLILKSLSKPVSFSSKSLSLRLHESGTTFSKYAADHGLKGPLYASMNHNYHTRPRFMGRFPVTHSRVLCLEYPVGIRSYKTSHDKVISPTMSNLRIQHIAPLFVLGRMSDYRFYSSSSGNNKAQAGYSASESNISGDHIDGSGVVDKVKEALQSLVDPSSYTAKKATEASDELIPLVQQLLNSHPYLKDFVVPVGCTLTGVVLAWTVMPKLLRRFHKYAMQSSTTLLYGGSSEGEKIPYEQSLWGALEDPIRYLITFMAFSQIGMMVAPTTIASEYISQTWRGGVILSCVWFLHRWKSNVFARVLTSPSLLGLDREKLVALDKVSSVGLFVLGLMALAEACGVAVQSILTVGGIGGVATAFAARDILGNVLSGLSMQFSKPFSIGDTIKAGSVEGQVIEMGLTTTLLLNAEKFPVIVPNSLFSSQVIVNKSRAQWRAMVIKIPVRIDDLWKIPKISNDVKTMLRSNENIFLGKEAPYCFMSYVESSHAQLNVGCNLKHMSKDEFYSTQEDILLQSVQIIKQHGGTLGSSLQEIISR